LLLLLFSSLAMGNALRGSDSPYLAMHADDPVQWRTWSPAVLAQARREGRLIFVSIGYFACHWCHVMQRESFRDPALARLLNARFIPVNVDRELNPALDAYLQDFVQRTRGIAGWPLNVILTPEGNPLVGAVYLPREKFRALLEGVQARWRRTPEILRRAAAAAARALQPVPSPPTPLTNGDVQGYRQALRQQALSLADTLDGGFGEVAKFPSPPLLEALLTAWYEAPDAALEAFLRLTLRQMAGQNLYDHIGGGFFRYTVDSDWQTPHFEKMLYDNAQLASLYLRAARLLHEPAFARVARETLDFLLREMRRVDGAFVASLSAVDEAGREGGHYLWDTPALRRVLDADTLAAVRTAWDIDGPPPFDGGYLPRPMLDPAAAAQALGMDVSRLRRLLGAARERLLAERRQRPLPVDDKALAGWNGLTLSALTAGARELGDARYRQAAAALREYLVHRLWDGQRLWRLRGREVVPATLADYAFAARGLLDWAELSGDEADRRLARQWVMQGIRRFHAADGWRPAEAVLPAAAHGRPLLDDGPLPSPAAVLLATAWRLAGDDAEERTRLRRLAAEGHSRLVQDALAHPGRIDLLVIIVRKPGTRRPPPSTCSSCP